MPTETGGPYLCAAVLCETVLIEQDGVVSAIRIVDRITLTPGPGAPEVMPQLPIQLRCLVILKAGVAQGSYPVKLTVTGPSGNEVHLATLPVLFEGNDRGVNLNLTINFVAQQEGLYWFSVFVHEQLLTRVPLRILYQRVGIGLGPANP